MATARASQYESRPKKPSCRIYIVRRQTIREIRIRPWLWALTGVFGLICFAAYIAATGYLVFRDDLLAASLARTARQQQAYEDRIAALRADIDQISGYQLLNQEQFEERLQEVASRQATIDRRKEILASLGQAASKAGLAPAPDGADSDTDEITTGSIGPAEMPEAGDTMQIVEASLDYVAEHQVAYIEKVSEAAGERAKRIATVLKEIGRPLPKSARNIDAMGGPFEPIPADADPDTFSDGVKVALVQVEQFQSLQKVAAGLPLSTPMSKGSITSRFGVRSDPFRRRPAMHTGIDFRAPSGQPARATAAGKVISAGYEGGYGNMVVIDHGGGITTRFAHLSQITAKKGQSVAKGDVVGKTGSTGRSTGPHLHYEIRVNGKAIDPMKFIRAGEQLTPVL